MSKIRQRGDTIVEVMFAFAALSAIIVGGLAIMNQATAVALRSLQVTLVRQEVDAQADMLRYVHDAYLVAQDSEAGKVWAELKQPSRLTTVGTVTNRLHLAECPAPSSLTNAFALSWEENARAQHMRVIRSSSPDFTAADVYSQTEDRGDLVQYAKAHGIWVDLVRVEGSSPNADTDAYDAYIQTCWPSPFGSAPVTLNTIVRLYEPKAR